MPNILFLTGISTEHQYLPPMQENGEFVGSVEESYALVFNYGEFRLPITREQAAEIDRHMNQGAEEPQPQVARPPANGTSSRSEPYEAGAEMFGGSDDYSSPPHHEVTETDDEEEDGVPQY